MRSNVNFKTHIVTFILSYYALQLVSANRAYVKDLASDGFWQTDLHWIALESMVSSVIAVA